MMGTSEQRQWQGINIFALEHRMKNFSFVHSEHDILLFVLYGLANPRMLHEMLLGYRFLFEGPDVCG